ncbi:MAG: hypothetical protein E6J85_19780 [Deltaproteobacteria bacterium]|nr:MAG: hypothetical protein E6J85_19780 [Deltaproteobacteria bacterium]
MSAFRGRVEKRDLEGGIFQLVADDGKRYTLVGSTSGLQAGAEMEIDGEVEAGGGFGLGMAGPQLRVKKVRKL